jgi:septal ring factor EnvC (AmiA/AmiB activator)
MELQVIEQNAIIAAYAKVGGTDELFERIAQEVRSFVPDVTTKKGRDEIGSLALKVSKSKTLIEKYGKELVAEQKAQIKLIDDDRISVVKKFDQLRDEILAPRDAWEQAEKDRIKKHEDSIESIKNNARYYIDTTLVELKQSLASAEQVIVDSSLEEFEQEAKIAKYEAIELLRVAIANREKYEAEQVELERLRKAEQERLQRERDERIAKEAADKARIEAENKARFEAEKVQREIRESADREARLIAEKEEAELRAQQAATVERQRIEREQAEKAESERQAEAERMANVEHMRTTNQEILNKLCEIGLDEGQAKAVITAIARNQIPNVSIKY